ncbi:MAG: hypothetical protein ACRDZQ_11920, partial [Acidimicrobiales bacterium]
MTDAEAVVLAPPGKAGLSAGALQRGLAGLPSRWRPRLSWQRALFYLGVLVVLAVSLFPFYW